MRSLIAICLCAVAALGVALALDRPPERTEKLSAVEVGERDFWDGREAGENPFTDRERQREWQRGWADAQFAAGNPE